MVDEAQNVNRFQRKGRVKRPMAPTGMRTQIYEIQTPAEADQILSLGVDHIGSVVVSESDWRQPELRETIRSVQRAGARSSLIPLFSTLDAVCRTLDYYGPDIAHFCELLPAGDDDGPCGELMALQEKIRRRFPEIEIMRSIPIAPPGQADIGAMLTLARRFQPLSDWFLTDTLQVGAQGAPPGDQPVSGFVGITGTICDWPAAAELVRQSDIPVILAGGLSPENVFEGCMAVRPAGVDSCTRTNAQDAEGRPIRFQKDLERVGRFVSETHRARAAMLE